MSAKSVIDVELAVGLGLAHAEDGGVEVDVLATGQLRVEARAGGDQAGDPAAGADRAAVGLHHALHQLEQGALARAVEAHQADRLALLDAEGDVVEGEERVGDLLATRHRHRHLLEGAVVLLGESLGDVLDDDRVGHQSLTVRLRDLVLEVGEDLLRDQQQDDAHRQGDEPAREQVVGHVVDDGLVDVARRRHPEAPLHQQHGDGDRVGEVELGVTVEALGDQAVGVHHRHAEADEVVDDLRRPVRCRAGRPG